jgi:hypothetical protein
MTVLAVIVAWWRLIWEQNVFKTIKELFSALVLSSVIGQALVIILPFPKLVAKSAKQLKIHLRKLY